MMNSEQNTNPVMIITACPNHECARTIARRLVNERAAACVQLFPIESVYRWEGMVEEESEMLLLIKTSSERFVAVSKLIREMHPYEVPEIIQLPITDGLPDYLNWIRESTEPQS